MFIIYVIIYITITGKYSCIKLKFIKFGRQNENNRKNNNYKKFWFGITWIKTKIIIYFNQNYLIFTVYSNANL